MREQATRLLLDSSDDLVVVRAQLLLINARKLLREQAIIQHRVRELVQLTQLFIDEVFTRL